MWIEQGVTAFAIWANGSQSFPRALARLRANAPPRFLNAFVLVFFFSQLTYFLSFFFFLPSTDPSISLYFPNAYLRMCSIARELLLIPIFVMLRRIETL